MTERILDTPDAPTFRLGELTFAAISILVALSDLFMVWLSGPAAVAVAKCFGFGASLDTQRVSAETLALAILLVAAYHLRGAYDGRRLLFLPISLGEVAIIWVAIYGVFAALIFPYRADVGFSRVSLPLLFGFGFASLAGVRLSFRFLGARLSASNYLMGPVVVVVTDFEGEALVKRLSALRAAGCNIQLVEKIPAAGANASVIDANLEHVMSFVRQSRIDEIVIVMRWTRVLELQTSLEILSTVPHPIRLLPDEELAWFLERAAYSSTIGNGVDLQRPPLGLSEQVYKRAFDVVLATLGLIVLMPVFVATACAIAYESGLPVFFLQWRGGYNNRRFRIWKFRTMNVTEDSSVVTQATRNDPRVTAVGRVLRKYSIDELPQLLNVITGDMSLVGPRPHALAHDRAYSQLIARYAARYNMKPGVTGWAQINGLRGETANPEVMRRRVEMDLWYIKNWAPWLDVKILAATVRAITNPSNHAF